MDESFGARLRRRREEQGIALATITEQTKIKQSLLDALERDDVSLWPSGIFRRAYVRAYAHAIGLDPDAIVREFLEVHPEPVEVVETLSPAALPLEGAWVGISGPGRLRSIVGSAIGSLSRMRRTPVVKDSPHLGSTPANSGTPTSSEPAAIARGSQATAHVAGDAVPAVSVAADRRAPDPGPDASHDSKPRGGRGEGGRVPAAPGRTVDVEAHHASSQPPLSERGGPNTPAASVPMGPDFLALANVCTDLGRVDDADAVQRLLRQAAEILDAVGLIVWVSDASSASLRPVLVHGYSDRVLAQLPPVTRESDNATAAAFRSGQPCVMNGADGTSGALVVPILGPAGCCGVLALELQHGAERTGPVLAAATILAALLAQLVGPAGS